MRTASTLSLALLAGAMLGLAQPTLAQTTATKLIAPQSEIAFVSKQMGVPVEGTFKKFDAKVAFDPRKPEAGSIAFTVDTASATLGVPETDAELPRPEWFGTVKFPQATFQSSSIKALGGGKFEVAGKLDIKGMVRAVVVPVTLTQSGATSTATGAFAIKRLDFNIGGGEWNDTSLVANDVQVKFKLALTGLGPL
ncbi:YceI family protein [Methylibium sp.]|uniref:YceI family protein n=1 Tax=Methylibium sp. TaxID=2067992 RepID=UPI00286A9311|nr:YceI family protein [Methylibium sp.]